jgi:hypothetical protein
MNSESDKRPRKRKNSEKDVPSSKALKMPRMPMKDTDQRTSKVNPKSKATTKNDSMAAWPDYFKEVGHQQTHT